MYQFDRHKRQQEMQKDKTIVKEGFRFPLILNQQSRLSHS